MKRNARHGTHYLTVALILGLELLLGSCAGTMAGIRNSYQAQRVYEAGLSKYQAKDYAAAIPQFRRALDLDQRFDDAETHLAWSYYHAGQYAAATKHFRQAVVRQPQWPGLYDGLGWSLLKLGDRQRARDHFEHALKIQPDFADAKEGLTQTEQLVEG
jgi:tetratricopeptide (TPR) repeat protein